MRGLPEPILNLILNLSGDFLIFFCFYIGILFYPLSSSFTLTLWYFGFILLNIFVESFGIILMTSQSSLLSIAIWFLSLFPLYFFEYYREKAGGNEKKNDFQLDWMNTQQKRMLLVPLFLICWYSGGAYLYILRNESYAPTVQGLKAILESIPIFMGNPLAVVIGVLYALIIGVSLNTMMKWRTKT